MGAARALARAGERILPRVPPAWQGAISEVAGTIAYLAAPRQRAAVRANLAMIAPGRSLSARRVFVNQVRQYLEVFQIPRLDRARFDEIVRVEGWDQFLCAQRLGKGVIFGRPALLPSAQVALALRTGAALLPAFAWREKGLLFARIEEPLELVSTGDRDADVRAGVRRFAAILERYIKEHPEQWTVFEPVWGTHGSS